MSTNTDSAYFFGFMGVAIAIGLSNVGAAIGTAKCAIGLYKYGLIRSSDIMRNIIPSIIASIQGVYGLIIAIILLQSISKTYDDYKGFAHFAAGLSIGFSSLAAGIAIGVCGEHGTRSNALRPKLFTGNLIVVSFASALGLYGLIAAMILSQA